MILRDNARNTPLPDSFEIRAAYETSWGNPFAKYDSADFRFTELDRSLRDVEVLEMGDNRMVIRPVSDRFRLEVSGFDINRDVIVRVRASGGAREVEP